MKRLPAFCGWISFLLPFVIYLLTLCPTVHWGDSGELITAAYTLGIPHPPGHPLYAIIGKLFTLIPIGSIAWRVNLMSAFFGAVTCFLIYKIILDRLEDSPWKYAAALGGALFFAFAPTVWDQTTVAETTTLHSAFMMLLTLLGFRLASGKIIRRNETYSLCLFSFLYGFSMTNHVAGVLFLPAFIYLFLSSYGKRILAPRLLIKMIVACFVASLVYLYLPIRSLVNPPLDWGNPENWRNFWWVVTARQYAPNLKTQLTIIGVLHHLIFTAMDLLHQFTCLGCILGLVGLIRLFREERRFVIFSFLAMGALFYVGLNRAFIAAYFVPGLALIAVFIGTGIERLIAAAPVVLKRLKSSCQPFFQKAVCGVLVASFVVSLGMNFREMDRSSDVYARVYGEDILKRLPRDSILFSSEGYAVFILWYLTFCEGQRRDILIIAPGWLVGKTPLADEVLVQYPSLRIPSLQEIRARAMKGKTSNERKFLGIQAILDENVDYRPVYWGIIMEDLPFFDHLRPHGILYSYSKTPVELTEREVTEVKNFWKGEFERYREHPEMKRFPLTINATYPVELNNQGLMFERLGRHDLAEWAIERSVEFSPNYALSHYNLGRLKARAGNYDEAIREYQLAIKNKPNMVLAYYNLGNAYRNLKKYDEAFLVYGKALRYNDSYYEAMTARGQLYAMVGQHKDAINEFQKSLNIEPEYPFALRGLASSYLAEGKMAEARDALLKALRLDPESAAGLYILAKYDARMGDPMEAARALRRSIENGGSAYLNQAAEDEDLKSLVRQFRLAESSQ
jgi:Tfp pilus assembly protein PilF